MCGVVGYSGTGAAEDRTQFIHLCRSYKTEIEKLAAAANQKTAIANAIGNNTREAAYRALSKNFRPREFGRFTMFNYTELLHHLCGVAITPILDLREAESSRNGLCIAVGMESAYTGRHGRALSDETIRALTSALYHIVARVSRLAINPRHKTLWSIETTLCAFKKHVLNNSRWVGYYIDRQRKEIAKLQSLTGKAAGGGVSWLPLWQFRAETYHRKYLNEYDR